MESLEEVAAELVEYLKFQISIALDASEPDAIGAAADAAGAYYQAVGTCELLLDAEVDAFFHHMIRCARARVWVLERSSLTPGYRPKVVKTSNNRGVLAAICAADWKLVARIASLSPPYNPRAEYEDDYWYTVWLHRAAQDDEAGAQGALVEYQRVMDGETSPRLRLCEAYMARDQAEALDAFDDLIDERRRELDEMKQKSLIAHDEVFVPFSSVYLEGLAWLRLLEKRGFTTGSEYMFCPEAARTGDYAPYVESGILGG